MILGCTCRNEFQDQRYGTGRRLHNPKRPVPGMPQVYRCSVCEQERTKAPVAKAAGKKT